MESLGEFLKSAREKKNVSLHEIADATRISLHYLQALEEGRYGELPGGMYNRAFLRSYAEHVGVEPASILRLYEAETSPPPEKSVRAKARLAPHREPFKLHPLVIWSVMLLASVAGLYLSRRWIASAFSPYFAQRPAMPTPPQPAAPQPSATDTQGPAAGLASGTGAGVTQPAGPAREGTPVFQDAAADVPASPADGFRIQFEVLATCWVSVSSDGTRVLVKLLEPGDYQEFDASERFYIVLGNAGGVRLRINGKPARPLGKQGEVVKVLITKQNLADFLENPRR